MHDLTIQDRWAIALSLFSSIVGAVTLIGLSDLVGLPFAADLFKLLRWLGLPF